MYAKETQVSIEKSQGEIRALLKRRGCDPVGLMEGKDSAFVAFQLAGVPVQIRLPIPKPNLEEFTHSTNGRERTAQAAYNAWDQACRARWRALRLVIQAKLEAVDAGITTLEREFLGDVVISADHTVGDVLVPQIGAIAATGKLPKLLPSAGGSSFHTDKDV